MSQARATMPAARVIRSFNRASFQLQRDKLQHLEGLSDGLAVLLVVVALRRHCAARGGPTGDTSDPALS